MTEPSAAWTVVVDRRRALALIGAAGAAVVVAGCSGGGADGTPEATASDRTATSGSPTSAPGTTTGVDCVLTPEMTEGPYYLDDGMLRRDMLRMPSSCRRSAAGDSNRC